MRDNFFRCVELDVSALGRYSHSFEQLRTGQAQAILVHNVLTAEQSEAVIQSIETSRPPMLQTWFPKPFRSCFFGRNLNLVGPDLSEYFAEATQFNQQLEQVLAHVGGFRAGVSDVLSQLDGGRVFRPAPGVSKGQAYMATTIRRHDEGGYIPAHCDNEFVLRPSYRHLVSIAQPHIYSFVLALTLPEAGGALEVFDYRAPAIGTALMSDDAHHQPDISSLDKVSLRIPQGTMAIFDSGCYLHRLSPVEGRVKRWTLCSFMSRSKHSDEMYCWG